MLTSLEKAATSTVNPHSNGTLVLDIFNLYFFIKIIFFSAVKRLMRESIELKDPNELFYCQPIQVCFIHVNKNFLYHIFITEQYIRMALYNPRSKGH